MGRATEVKALKSILHTVHVHIYCLTPSEVCGSYAHTHSQKKQALEATQSSVYVQSSGGLASEEVRNS